MKINWDGIAEELKTYPHWVLWKYEQRDGKATKVPYQVTGFKASVVDPTHWSTFEQVKEAFEAGGYSGVGVVFSQGYDLMGLDLDDVRDGEEQTDDATEILKALGTYAEISPSGRGLKLFVRGHLPEGKGSRADLPGGGHLEAYSWGRYFTVTGQQLGGHPVVEAQEGLDQVADDYLPDRAPLRAPKQGVYTVPGNVMDRARAYLSKIEPAITGEGGHNHTFHVACILVNGFALEQEQAMELIQEWNQGCLPPWSFQELKHKLESAWETGQSDPQGRGYLLASQEAQWQLSATPAEPGEYQEVYLDELLSKLGGAQAAFPEHLLSVPGLVGMVGDWITSQNHRPNKVLSLLAAIALQSVLIGRKVKCKCGARPKLYLVGLAPSGGGKQAPQNCIIKILTAIGAEDLFGGKVASDTAMVEDLAHSPAKLYLWDEFGRFLDRTKEGKGGAHLHAVQQVLLEVWGFARTTYQGKAYADRTKNKAIDQPNLSFLGLSVAPHFWDALELGHLRDGFAARLLVVDSGPKVGTQPVEEMDPPQEILEQCTFWRDHRGMAGNLAKEHPDPMVVPETDDATAAFQELLDRQEAVTDEDEAPVWSRAIEKAKALALVYATSKDHEAPVIDVRAARWGIELATWATEYFIRQAKDEITEPDRFAQKLKQGTQLIKKMSSKKQQCTRSLLLKRLKVSAIELNQIIATMLESGDIEQRQQVSGSGRPATYFVAKGV